MANFAGGSGADRPRSCGRRLAMVAALIATLGLAGSVQAGKLSWLDDVVQEVVREAEAGGKIAARGADGAITSTRVGSRLFAKESEESLEILAKRSDDLAKMGRRGVEATGEAALQKRFLQLVPRDAEGARVFAALAPAEKRLVVEMGETAQRLARRYPGQAEGMIRALGTEGMSAVHVFGDDVAEVIVKEGVDSVGILRKTGRGGWTFFTDTVLPNKKKLVAAGVFGAFLADPDKFVDYAGRATELAVREFGKAGVSIAGAVTAGAARGIEATVGQVLEAYGWNVPVARYVGMVVAGVVALWAGLVLVGLPVRWMLAPLTWPLRRVSAMLGRRARVA